MPAFNCCYFYFLSGKHELGELSEESIRLERGAVENAKFEKVLIF